ncbi:DUF2399 domain-containing protein [Amycolatopsis sp. NPDC049252]|uniref:DUF2399 domain-containing protein n=1 Tax=Amycolatopsis sp. NPDC049252 TaxID=3363933 RepID=UPI003718C508
MRSARPVHPWFAPTGSPPVPPSTSSPNSLPPAARSTHEQDFDLAGFTIADQVLSVASSALSWRFNARTYTEECGPSGHHDAPNDLLATVAELRVVCDRTRSPVHEERVLTLLLSDLVAGASIPTKAPVPSGMPSDLGEYSSRLAQCRDAQ